MVCDRHDPDHRDENLCRRPFRPADEDRCWVLYDFSVVRCRPAAQSFHYFFSCGASAYPVPAHDLHSVNRDGDAAFCGAEEVFVAVGVSVNRYDDLFAEVFSFRCPALPKRSPPKSQLWLQSPKYRRLLLLRISYFLLKNVRCFHDRHRHFHHRRHRRCYYYFQFSRESWWCGCNDHAACESGTYLDWNILSHLSL